MASWAWLCWVNNVARDYIDKSFVRAQEVGCWEGWGRLPRGKGDRGRLQVWLEGP